MASVQKLLTDVSVLCKEQADSAAALLRQTSAAQRSQLQQVNQLLQSIQQSTLYLDAFRELLQNTPLYLPSQRRLQLELPRLDRSVKVRREMKLEQYGKADIVLDCPDGYIVIENKAGAVDSDQKWHKCAFTAKIRGILSITGGIYGCSGILFRF